MKKIIRTISVFLVMLCFSGCGETTEEITEATTESTTVEITTETTEKKEETPSDAEFDEELQEMASQLDAIGDTDVDTGLFNVTITVSKEFIGDVTQEEIDESLEKNGYKSGKVNEDGSVTYVMTKAQHEELLDTISQEIDKSISDIIDQYANTVSVTPNDNYTSFVVVTKNQEIDLNETFLVPSLYTFGGMYAAFSGEEAENIHIDFKNEESGEIINTADSKNMQD